MVEIMQTGQTYIFFQLLLAVVLGSIVGLEREYSGKEAGLRTYSLVALGSALFTVLGREGLSGDSIRVIQAVAIGIGFLGAGIIIQRQSHIEGLTSAAGLWTVAAVGIAVGSGMYWLAIFATSLVVITFAGFRPLESKVVKIKKSASGRKRK
jgi:putative Mg2+ transporter-C (MgtC) family protein